MEKVKYCVRIMYNGKFYAYLWVKDVSSWYTKRIAIKHAKDACKDDGFSYVIEEC